MHVDRTKRYRDFVRALSDRRMRRVELIDNDTHAFQRFMNVDRTKRSRDLVRDLAEKLCC